MRLFVALDIPDAIRHAIAAYVDELRRVAPDAKWVRAESFHITLKFIGEWRRDVSEVIEALKKVEALPVDLAIRGSGFFPNPHSSRVFWVGIEADRTLAALARRVDEACAALGMERESREFSPHLTLARSGSGSPRPRKDEKAVPSMKRLAERMADLPAPDFGTIHATEFFLYESKLSPSGAQYKKLKSFALVDGSR
ncbi:MAG TPA: RNA 2',3'-cyclic phosphodiesterase [Terriglobales bacterium]|nr:RNA 2',3'-cyclic phosphodiesterase [Terriglobales bacterium]